MRAGTIVASNYVAMAQVLAESFLAHHPESVFEVLVIDDGPADLPGPIRVARLDDLDLETSVLDAMKTVYDVMEFATAVKPAFLGHLLDGGREDEDVIACYLDPDIVVYQPFDDQVAPALDHGIVLTPHVLSPVPRDGMKVDEVTIMQSGMYNCGFLAVTDRARDFLEWWDVRLRFDAVVDFEQSRFTDQRWVDWVPSLFDFHISRDPGMNVAWWNIHERPVDASDTVPMVDGRPVRFIHFSGYDPDSPDRLSKHQEPCPRVRPEIGTGIRTLADDYGDRLRVLGHNERRRAPYQWDVARDGTALTRDVRRRVRAALLDEIDHLGERRTVPDAFGFGSDNFGRWVAETTTGRVERVAAGEPAAPEAAPVDRATYDVEYEPGGVHERVVGLLAERSARGTVVDLGCGYAPHAAPLAAAGFEFVGVDANAESVAALSGRGVDARELDLDVEGGLESLLNEVGAGAPVVAVLLLDVLEHLAEPHLFLARLRSILEQHPHAVVVASVPNVSHVDVAAKLVAGRWDVTPTGLLDETHLRFFTSTSLTEMMESAAFSELARRDRPAIRSDQHWPERSPFVAHDTPLARFLAALRGRADDDAHTYQFVRMYTRVEQSEPNPTLVAAAREAPSCAVTVVVDGANDQRVTEVGRLLDAQTSDRWELIVTTRAGATALNELVGSVCGDYLVLLGPDDVIATDWVATFDGAARDAQGEPTGAVLRLQAAEARDSRAGAEERFGPSGSYAFPVDAIRVLRPTSDGEISSAVVSLLLQTVPMCGLATVPSDAVHGPPVVGGADLVAELGVIAAASVGEPVLTSSGERQAHADARRDNVLLRRRLDQLEDEATRLRTDVRWLNAELAVLPVRVIRRLARRPRSSSSTD